MKTFHGGLTDLKYERRVLKHVCHPLNGKHECCLVEIYHMYLGLVQDYSNKVTAFYFKLNCKRFTFDEQPLRINTLKVVHPAYLTQVWKRS